MKLRDYKNAGIWYEIGICNFKLKFYKISLFCFLKTIELNENEEFLILTKMANSMIEKLKEMNIIDPEEPNFCIHDMLSELFDIQQKKKK